MKILFPGTRGGRLSADGVQHLLARHIAKARKTCPSLKKKRVYPHVLRHAAAMKFLQVGVDRAVIALGWAMSLWKQLKSISMPTSH